MTTLILALLLQLPSPAPALNSLEWRGVDRLGYPALFSQPKPETFTF